MSSLYPSWDLVHPDLLSSGIDSVESSDCMKSCNKLGITLTSQSLRAYLLSRD